MFAIRSFERQSQRLFILSNHRIKVYSEISATFEQCQKFRAPLPQIKNRVYIFW